jgi:hypothetical protein
MNDIDIKQTAGYFAQAIRGRKFAELEFATILCRFYRATNRADVLRVSDAVDAALAAPATMTENDINVRQTARYFARAIRGFELTEAELASILCQFYCATNRGDVLTVCDALEYVRRAMQI